MKNNAKVINGQCSMFSIFETEDFKFNSIVSNSFKVEIPCAALDTTISNQSNLPEIVSSNEDVIIEDVIPKVVSKDFKDKSVNNIDDAITINAEVFTSAMFNKDSLVPYVNNNFIANISDVFKGIIDKYKDTCKRIVKSISGALLVEMDGETLYFNKDGYKEMILSDNLPVLPGYIMLVINEDKPVSEKQIEILNELNISKCIKRIGDSNIYFLRDQTICINNKGWILEYQQEPIYDKSMIYSLEPTVSKETIILNTNSDNENSTDSMLECTDIEYKFSIGDDVIAKYGDDFIEGTVYSVYNNGETINIKWNNCISAFYYKLIVKKN